MPSVREKVANMIALAQISSSDIIYDLGSGDGRLVFAALDAGAKKGTGYEINPILVKKSQWWAQRKKYGERASFVCQSMFGASLHDADVVFLYQLSKTMVLLEEKLLKELKPGARVVSSTFPFKDWKPVKIDGKVLLYIKDASVPV